MEEVDIRKMVKRFAPRYHWTYGNLPARCYRRDKEPWGLHIHLHQKY